MSQLVDILSRKLNKFRQGSSAQAKALCPFHQETVPSFSVNMDSGVFYCHGCQASGSVKTLLKHLGYPYASLDSLVSSLQLESPQRRARGIVGKTKELPDYLLGAYDKCPVSLLDDGFDKNLLKLHEIGFDEENLRITFPMRDVRGNLIAVSGRTVTNSWAKYKFYEYREEFPDYILRPHEHLWGEDKLAAREDSDTPVERIILCEGFKAALWVIQNGYFALALAGTRIYDEQIRTLSRFYAHVTLFLDNDEAGIKGTDKAIEKLISQVPKLDVVEYPDDAEGPDEEDERTQADDFSEDELKEMVDNPILPILWRINVKKKGKYYG